LLPAIVLALLLLAPPQATAAFPGENGGIVFVDFVFEPNAEYELFVATPGGGAADRITTDDYTDLEPTWSPDGTRIAFTRQFCPSSCFRRVMVMNADGSGVKQLTFGTEALAIPENHSPSWSPDGTRIAYVAEDDGSLLYVVNSDGSGRRKLTSIFATYIFTPVWSPDGREIAFTRQVNLASDVYSVRADGTNFRPVTQQDLAFAPAWSPDGTQIAYLHRAVWAGPTDVWVANRDGSDPANLTETDGVIEYGPWWSPDGTTLLYTREVDGGNGNDIIVRDVATGTETNITDSPSVAENALSWSPDGTKILYRTSAGLGVMDADGSNQVPFGTSSGYDADWQPLCTITGTIAGEMLTGTDGADVICGGGGNDTIVGGGGNDIIFGGDGSDKLDGGEGADSISGQGGNDTLIPGAGDDLVAGAGGTDTVSYALALTPVSLSLTTGKATGEGLDTLVTIENAIGSASGDVLVGNKRANLLRGRAGGDRLLGADGNDVLLGDAGNDTLNGGPGTDKCRQGTGTGPRRSCESR
jgi:Tol biopolymer transport system component